MTDLDSLERLWNRCVELLDTRAVDENRAQSSDYYHAQSQAMTAAFEALPTLIQRLREAEAERGAANEALTNALKRIAQLERVREAAYQLDKVVGEEEWIVPGAFDELRVALAALEEPVKL